MTANSPLSTILHIESDDFGTGYSSLSYLRRFPIGVLKIDQSFVKQITAGTDDSMSISAIISMGKSLKHHVVAEGIETREQMACFQAQGCPEEQGHLFSRSVPAAEFVILLKAGTIAIPACNQSQPEESLAVAATP